MRIAVTSQNFRTITGHAGKARRFLMFEGTSGGEPMETARLDLPKEMSFHEFHGENPHPVDGSDVIVTQSCGSGFRQRMTSRGIAVVVTAESDPLTAARALLKGEPLPPPETTGDHGGGDNHHGHH